ncbi:amidohydrolase family protein [Goodfellowiella coeruleoviolacea]|uniref:Metal-dependent hydrolase, TIM-barrel fold n=1 Tax=Goodfellowiella coeruleoviolacea TaxID=334858 RepID=A0AAE3GDP1_9PSEU|nr:amidohydrolase family protein [Goodfellowiella coeruleoviolacea]MCP2166225.1 putative metal-dependent hydrolase, TIM-barrel fold [Goodfellowiella coeruleoviolacea]
MAHRIDTPSASSSSADTPSADTPRANTHRVDTHSHVVPPDYRAHLLDAGWAAGGLPIPQWTESEALAVMDDQGIQTAVLSVSTPGVHFGDDAEARTWARRVNEFAAERRAGRPDRFGFFATLPLPDVDGALAEAAHALDELDADGVVLLANSNGRYLGDPEFEPLMAELGRRGAVVFVHPGALPGGSGPGVPDYVVDFLLDTTRAAVNLARTHTLSRHPDLKVILSHGGGFVPYAAFRIAATLSMAGGHSPEDTLAELRRFYFDTALTASPVSLPSLLAFAAPDHVLYGSDWPYAPTAAVEFFTGQLDAHDLDAETRQAIERGTAEQLFPRLASAG